MSRPKCKYTWWYIVKLLLSDIAEIEGVWPCSPRRGVQPERGAAGARVQRGAARVSAGGSARPVPATAAARRCQQARRAHSSLLTPWI